MSLDNSKFRELLATQREEKEAAAPAAMSAEERARKKAKQQESYERRMAIQKRREEALAEASRYTDRAAARRTEEAKQRREDGPESFYDAEEAEAPTHHLSDGPTFAQLGDREDLSQQQHRVSITQSKYLGGDIEHTHLVKGLDFALLQKMRSELSAADAAKLKKEEEDALKRAARQRQLGGAGSGKQPSGSKPKPASSLASGAGPDAGRDRGRSFGGIGESSVKVAFGTEMAREVHHAIFREHSRPNRALAEGRLVLVFDVTEGGMDIPSTLVRATDDLSGPARPTEKLHHAGLPDALASRLARVLSHAPPSSDRPRKVKKEKLGATAPVSHSLPKGDPAPPPAPRRRSPAPPISRAADLPRSVPPRSLPCDAHRDPLPLPHTRTTPRDPLPLPHTRTTPRDRAWCSVGAASPVPPPPCRLPCGCLFHAPGAPLLVRVAGSTLVDDEAIACQQPRRTEWDGGRDVRLCWRRGRAACCC